MSDRWTELIAARRRAAAAHARLSETTGALQHRLAPATLASEGRREAKVRAYQAGDMVAANPARTAIVVGSLIAFLARHQIADAIASGTRRLRGREHQPELPIERI